MKTLILFLIFFNVLNASWIDQKAEGWAWYQDFYLKDTMKIETKKEIELTPEEILEIQKKELSESLAKAILEPTEINLLNYLKLQKKLLDQSSNFALLWKKVILFNPEYNLIANNVPISQYGVQLNKINNSNKLKKYILNLSKEHILLFCYKGKEIISKEVAKVINNFSVKYNFIIYGFAIDNFTIEIVKNKVLSQKIYQNLSKYTPALYLINPKEQKLTPLAFGIVSETEIENNIELIFKEKIYD